MRSKTSKIALVTAIALLISSSGMAVNWSDQGFDKGKIPAGGVTVDTSSFSGSLSSADTDVQHALNTLDAAIGGVHGVPSGGVTNQALAKNSNTNYDLKWETVVTAESDPLSLHLDQSTPQTVTASPKFNWLTATRIPYVGALGVLTDSANLTFDGTRLSNTDYIDFNDTDKNTKIGYQAGKNLVSGAAYNTFVGHEAGLTGVGTTAEDGNSGVGSQALTSLTSGQYNSSLGYQSSINVTTGKWNTVCGSVALFSNSTGNGNIALGFMAGAYETGSNSFYVDNQDRFNTAGDKAKALLYGTFNSAPASQTLAVNGVLSSPYTSSINTSGNAATVTTNANLTGDVTSVGNAATQVKWATGYVWYVPLSGDIATYITAASAGDTLVLAAGTYTITSGLTVNKKLHIMGQGEGITTITCAIDLVSGAMLNFTTTDGSYISDMTISYSAANITGNSSLTSWSVNGLISNVQFIDTSTGTSARFPAGVYMASAKQVDIENCTYAGSGSVAWHGFVNNNTASATVNVRNCNGTSSGGSSVFGNALLYVGASGAITNAYNCSFLSATNQISGILYNNGGAINSYNCILNGSGATAFDVKNASGTLTLYDTTLVNNTTSGTITYGGTVQTAGEYVGGASTTALKVGSTPDLVVDTTNHRVGVGVQPATAGLSVDPNSNTAGIRLFGLDETKEIADIYVNSVGALLLDPATPGTDTYPFVGIIPEANNDYGLLVYNGSYAVPYLNITAIDAATDYVNLCVNAPRATLGLTIDANQDVAVNNLSIRDSKNISFDPAPASDHNCSGIISTGTAGQSLAFGDLCYQNADGSYYKAKGDSSTTMPAVVMAVTTIGTGASGNFLQQGYARDASWSFTVGGTVWVSEATAGLATTTQPSTSGNQIQAVGYATAATYMYFQSCPPVVIEKS